MGGGLGRVTHHPEFYLEDGSVSFLTGGILFRVHKTFFQRESEVFRDLFASAADDNPPSGTDACPFTLDVTPDDFAQFLWVWYNSNYGYREQTKDNWLTILRLATRWHFYKIKELALREIEFLELPPAERISIYDDLGIDGERLISSCVELCKSPRVPTQDEARSMRMDTLIKILQARENAQRKAVEMGHESPTSACLEDDVLKEIVSKLFEKSLNPLSSGMSTGSGDQASDLKTVHKTLGTTIKMGDPQVPDRKTTDQPPSHPNTTLLTNSDGKESREKEESRVESNGVHKQEGREVGGEEGKKPAKAAGDKEKTERGEAEKAKQGGKEKVEKTKQDKDKEAGKVEQQKSWNNRNKPRGS